MDARSARNLMVGLALAGAGCDSGSVEDLVGSSMARVSIDASATSGLLDRTPFFPSRLDCTVQLTARATGASNAYAAWTGGVLRYFEGADRSTPVDSAVVTVEALRSAWGADRIAGGDEQSSAWEFQANVPFGISGSFTYENGFDDEPGTAEFQVDCGPRPADGGTAPPSVTNLTVSPASGVLEPLDSLTLTFTVNAPRGLWNTAVALSGAFRDTLYLDEHDGSAEPPSTTASRTVRIGIPRGSALGERVHARVLATDVDARVRASEVVSTPPLEDHMPPDVEVRLSSDPARCLRGTCQYASGEHIHFDVVGDDNDAIAWLVYEIGDPVIWRDSISPEGASYPSQPIRPEWLGTHPVQVEVRDISGNTTGPLLVGQRIHVFPVRTYPTATVDLDMALGDVAYDHAAGRLYLTAPGMAEVVVLTVDPLAVVDPIPLPGPADGLDLTVGGDSLLVVIPDSNTIAVVDLSRPVDPPTLVPLAAVDTAAGFRASSMRVVSNGKWFVTANRDLDLDRRTARLVEVDPLDGGQTVRLDSSELGAEAAVILRRLVRTGDRSRLLVSLAPGACTYLYDAAADALGACTPYDSAEFLELAAPDWSGTRWSTRYALLDGTLAFIRPLPTRISTQVTAPAPDGTLVFTTNDLGFEVIDAETALIAERIPLPYLDRGRFLHSPAGDRVVAVGRSSLYGLTQVVVIERR